MKAFKTVLILSLFTMSVVCSSCTDESGDIFPQDELNTGGNGEGSDPITNGPPSGS